MVDVLVVGAGLAGSVAALALARAGARVLVVDRANGPQAKTWLGVVRPGAAAALAEAGVVSGTETSHALDGVLLTTSTRARLWVRRGPASAGRAVRRSALVAEVRGAAVAAGAQLQLGVSAEGPMLFEEAGRRWVRGASLQLTSGRALRVPAGITIVACGQDSSLARAAGVSSSKRSATQWASSMEVDRVDGLGKVLEIHVGPRGVVALCPIDGRAIVLQIGQGAAAPGDAEVWLDDARRLGGDLARRLAATRGVAPPDSMALVDSRASAAGVPGLLLAGSAYRAVHPLWDDEVAAAVLGGRSAAVEALRELEAPSGAAHLRLRTQYRLAELATRGRGLWRLLARPPLPVAAGLGVRLVPSLARAVARQLAW